MTFAQLFDHPRPALALLRQVKSFAKAHMESPEGGFPRPVAAVLYYASIAAARVHSAERITHLRDDAFRGAIGWSLAQPWLCEPLVTLFRAAADELTGARPA
jgi:hypothetical protein